MADLPCARETLEGVLDVVVAETMADLTTEDCAFGGALTDPVIESFIASVVDRLKAHNARHRASAVGAPAGSTADPSPINSDARTAIAPSASLLHSGACTAQMDQPMVWQHIIRFRPTNHAPIAACLAAVSPQVRRLSEAEAKPSPVLTDVSHLLWWLCRQPTVALHLSDAALANGTLLSLLAQLPGRLDLTVDFTSTDTSLVHLQGLTQLQTLNLSYCELITGAGLAHLQGLTQLQTLDLSRCWRISDAGLVHLQGLTLLQTLHLSYCRLITDAGLAHLQGLTQLQALDLYFCRLITDAGLAHLQGLTQLQTLDLSSCEITDAGLVHLQGLTQLRSLNLRCCERITDAGLVHLQGQTLNLACCGRITRRVVGAPS